MKAAISISMFQVQSNKISGALINGIIKKNEILRNPLKILNCISVRTESNGCDGTSCRRFSQSSDLEDVSAISDVRDAPKGFWGSSEFKTNGDVASFKFSDLKVDLVPPGKLKMIPDSNNLNFGRDFSDHMLKINYDDGGWSTPVICPFENLSLHPASKVFHYAIELFEGLKAYRGYDNKIRVFRPELNMERMNISAARSDLPRFQNIELLQCIFKLLQIDKNWVPESQSASLYIRPTMIGTEPTLGIGASKSALLYVILSPVGSYFGSEVKPVSLMADPRFARAWPGGVGNIKMGSNYAPTIHVQKKAMYKGHSQVLWLYGNDYQLTEAGTMNLFLVIKNRNGEKELITPEMNGLILPGITRQSIIEIFQEFKGIKVTERVITMPEVLQLVEDGNLLEMFGSGTACVVCPINGIWFQNRMLTIPTMEQRDPVYGKALNILMDIQYGKINHPWARIIE